MRAKTTAALAATGTAAALAGCVSPGVLPQAGIDALARREGFAELRGAEQLAFSNRTGAHRTVVLYGPARPLTADICVGEAAAFQLRGTNRPRVQARQRYRVLALRACEGSTLQDFAATEAPDASVVATAASLRRFLTLEGQAASGLAVRYEGEATAADVRPLRPADLTGVRPLDDGAVVYAFSRDGEDTVLVTVADGAEGSAITVERRREPPEAR